MMGLRGGDAAGRLDPAPAWASGNPYRPAHYSGRSQVRCWSMLGGVLRLMPSHAIGAGLRRLC